MDSTSLAPAIVVGAVYLIVLIGAYLWYAIALSKLFPLLGAPAWKGWVPIVNEAEILTRGGVPGWSVVFYFIPIAQFYGLYLKAVATQRINGMFGRGAGMTVLALLVPPLWATVLVAGRRPEVAEPVTAPVMVTPVIPGVVDARRADAVAGPFVDPDSGMPAASFAVVPVAVPPPVVSPIAPPPNRLLPPPEVPAVPAVPVVPVVPAPIVAPEPPAVPFVPTPPIGVVSVPIIVEPPGPSAPVASPAAVTPTSPWGPGVPRPELVDPVAVQPPVRAGLPDRIVEVPAVQAEVGVDDEDSVEVGETDTEVGAPGNADLEADIDDEIEVDDDDDDELAATVVVDRRPVVPWKLHVEGGPTFSLTGETVVLGRKPDGTGPDIQRIAVPDTTRTLSKVHARLDLDDGAWVVTDLNATNGVIVIEPDGTERLLPAGASAEVLDRFILGKVGMRIGFDDDSDDGPSDASGLGS